MSTSRGEHVRGRRQPPPRPQYVDAPAPETAPPVSEPEWHRPALLGPLVPLAALLVSMLPQAGVEHVTPWSAPSEALWLAAWFWPLAIGAVLAYEAALLGMLYRGASRRTQVIGGALASGVPLLWFAALLYGDAPAAVLGSLILSALTAGFLTRLLVRSASS